MTSRRRYHRRNLIVGGLASVMLAGAAHEAQARPAYEDEARCEVVVHEVGHQYGVRHTAAGIMRAAGTLLTNLGRAPRVCRSSGEITVPAALIRAHRYWRRPGRWSRCFNTTPTRVLYDAADNLYGWAWYHGRPECDIHLHPAFQRIDGRWPA